MLMLRLQLSSLSHKLLMLRFMLINACVASEDWPYDDHSLLSAILFCPEKHLSQLFSSSKNAFYKATSLIRIGRACNHLITFSHYFVLKYSGRRINHSLIHWGKFLIFKSPKQLSK